MRPALVLVTGAPATGKTTLAAELARGLGWPLLSRDRIKEVLWDALGPGDAGGPDLVRRAQWPVFYALVAELLDAGGSVVAEGCVHRDWAPAELAPLLARSQARVVHCHASRALAHARFAERARAGARHASHGDLELAALIRHTPDRWAHFEQPPELGVPLLRVNTTSGLVPDLAAVLAFVRPAGG